MKKNIYTIMFLSLFQNYMLSQACSDLINTEPETTINTFDWTQETYTFKIGTPSGNITETVFSPFYWTAANNNIYHLNDVLVKDFEPEDGWELINTYFGTDEIPISTPYIVLYNRYEGVLRTFAWIRQELESFSSARVKLNFNPSETYQSAALNLLHSPTTSLDNWIKEVFLKVPIHIKMR